MTLFSAPRDPWSHRTRIVLAEKSISIDIVDVEPGKYPEDLLDLNPYHTVPTLVDRDLVLYDSRVIIEYLDERFPHPPLMPVDPVTRAQFRLALYRIERDWYTLLRQIEVEDDKKQLPKLRKVLRGYHRAGRGSLQGEAFLHVRRVLAGRCDHRADPLAAAALRDRAAAEGAADPQVRQPDLLPRRVSRVPVGAGARDAALRR